MIVIQAALLVAVHATADEVVVTATLPVAPAAATLADVCESTNAGAACVTVTVRPAIVTEPERLAVVVFAAAAKKTLPLPEPEAPALIVSQDVLVVAVRAHAAGAVTAAEYVPPSATALTLAGVTVKVQVIPAWVIEKEMPAIVIAPERAEVVVLAATL